ncbi:hypothetical protein B7463_g3558, partial [Scytalidium lignicola]
MALLPRVAVVLVAFGAAIYQLYLKRFLFTTMGIGRLVEPLRRSLNDRMAVLDTRGEGTIASRLKWISMENFLGTNGDEAITMHGIDVRPVPNSNKLRVLLVNHRPSVDPVTGEFLDSQKIGGNSTIEVFEMALGGDTMRHVKTYADEVIQVPNRAQWIDDNSFVFTNDHDRKVGMLRNLESFTGGGSVGYCDPSGCKIIKDSGFYNPNGIGVGSDGLVYVPNTISGDLDIFTLNSSHQLEEVASVKTGYPLDNLHIDKNGDVYAAAFPQLYKLMASGKQPLKLNPPTAVLKFRKVHSTQGTGSEEKPGNKPTWVFEKVLEDDGSVLPGTTVAVHDELMDRIFLGGVVSPFIAICERKKIRE